MTWKLTSSVALAGFLVMASNASGAFAQVYEDKVVTEADDISVIRELALVALAREYPEGVAVLVRRDAHAKAHGCVKAMFTVDGDLKSDLRVGTFVPGAIYKTWIRFSNGAFHPGSDTGMDGRGMAVKILLPSAAETSEHTQTSVHDILMINHPVFFSTNAADYRAFAEAGALTGASEGLRAYFMPSYNPFGWRIRQAKIAYAIASKEITSPLAAQYFSMAPFRFGVGRAVKYSAKPCLAQNAVSIPKGDNFLRQALGDQLADRAACFQLMVQKQVSGMPIEDPTVDWDQQISPYVRVGILHIPRQQIVSKERDEFCEAVRFHPWSAPSAHSPLGGMNRVRKAVYDGISEYRTIRNHASSVNASSAWDGLE